MREFSIVFILLLLLLLGSIPSPKGQSEPAAVHCPSLLAPASFSIPGELMQSRSVHVQKNVTSTVTGEIDQACGRRTLGVYIAQQALRHLLNALASVLRASGLLRAMHMDVTWWRHAQLLLLQLQTTKAARDGYSCYSKYHYCYACYFPFC